ncbi:MAG: MFS transporter, partial [Candidatus Alcyoniella australis]|nr:MFS transporter [Candidatus Alcyoniella australis]
MNNPSKKKLPRNVRALGVVSLANDAASEMIVPLLPAFVVGVLGLGPAFLGAIEGLAESTASLLKLVSGWYSDRVRRRKPLAVFGYSLSNLLRPLIGLATAGWHVLFLRFFDRVGKGIRTSPRDALLASEVEEGQRGRAFGYQRALDNLGAAIGPLLAAGLLLLFPGNLRLVFVLSIVPGAAAVLILTRYVRERRPEQVVAPPVQTQAEVQGSPLAGGVPRGAFRTYLFAVVLFTLGNSSDVFLVLRAQDLGVSLAQVPLLWMLLSLVRALAGTWGGAVSDRIGRRRTIIVGWGLYAVVYLLLGLATTAWHVWALFAAYGMYYALVEGPERALV